MTVPATWLWLQTGEARMAIRRAASNCWKSRGIGKFKFQATNSRGHANKRACPLQDCPVHSLPARYELPSSPIPSSAAHPPKRVANRGEESDSPSFGVCRDTPFGLQGAAHRPFHPTPTAKQTEGLEKSRADEAPAPKWKRTAHFAQAWERPRWRGR